MDAILGSDHEPVRIKIFHMEETYLQYRSEFGYISSRELLQRIPVQYRERLRRTYGPDIPIHSLVPEITITSEGLKFLPYLQCHAWLDRTCAQEEAFADGSHLILHFYVDKINTLTLPELISEFTRSLDWPTISVDYF